jgi:shikimate kinase
MKNNIILIGFMGSGKSTVGLELANQMNFPFCDTDVLIEQNAKTTISNIFAEKGEEYFRNLETKTLEEMVQNTEKMIIATGGGLPLRECNAKLLKDLGFVVYLKVTKETVLKRLKGDTSRPILAGDNVDEKIDKLLEYREPLYEISAHMQVVVDNKTVPEIVDEIIRNFNLLENHKNK